MREDALVRKQRRGEEALINEAEVSLRDHNEFNQWKEELKIKGNTCLLFTNKDIIK